MRAQVESLVVLSDVHLGSDLNDAGPVVPRSSAIDRDLVSCIEHYASNAPPAGRWRMIIAGDFIDFAGMAIEPEADAVLTTELTEEEIEHGLGSAEDHARQKLRRVKRRHDDVFAALGKFVAAGHAITILHGNHDLELHWEGVRADFRDSVLGASATEAERVRIEFSPLFFYRDGVVYIEHGHQYDPFCATAHPLAPVSPLDPRRVVRAFSDVLLRFVVRKTQGMREHGHETKGLLSYIAFAVNLGVSGMWKLLVRFARSIREAIRLQRAYLSEGAQKLRAEHERRAAELAKASRVGVERVQRLLSLHATPVSHSISAILASVLIDRLALAFFAIVALTVAGVLALTGHTSGALYTVIGTLVGWGAVHFYLTRTRNIDPAMQMQQRATQLVRLFPAAFVVMGHTHVPVQASAGQTTYINVGSWAEEEEEPEAVARGQAYRAARTHLVIHERDGRVEASLYEWDSTQGTPRKREA